MAGSSAKMSPKEPHEANPLLQVSGLGWNNTGWKLLQVAEIHHYSYEE